MIGPYKNLISVEGAVKRTGVYELKEGQTLSELVSYFGGFTPKAYTKLLILERLNGIQKEVKEIALTESDNFIMRAGDKLVVQEILNTFENKVSIQGEVFRPGDFELLDKINHENLFKIFPHTVFCNKNNGKTCPVHNKDNIFYFDSEHLSMTGATMLQDEVLKIINTFE